MDWADLRAIAGVEEAPAAHRATDSAPSSSDDTSSPPPSPCLAPPPPGAPAGGTWVRTRSLWRCCGAAARSEYRKGTHVWDEQGRMVLRLRPGGRVRWPGATKTVVGMAVLGGASVPTTDKLAALDPKLVTAPAADAPSTIVSDSRTVRV